MALDYKTGVAVMMQLGSFQFGISTAAYQSIKRSSEYRWSSQDRFGKGPVSQFVGVGSESISLQGVIYPEFRGGIWQISSMRTIAGNGEPLLMVDGRGNMMSRWVIERVESDESTFADAGIARKQEFTLQLKRFFEENEALEALYSAQAQPIPTTVANDTAPAIPATAETPVSKIKGLANSVSSAGASLVGAVSKAYAEAQAAIAPGTELAKDVLGAISRCSEVAGEMQFTANRVLAVVGKSPINITAISAAKTMSGTATSVLTGADSAGALLRRTTKKLQNDSSVPKSTVKAVRNAANVADRTSTFCRQSASEANKITE